MAHWENRVYCICVFHNPGTHWCGKVVVSVGAIQFARFGQYNIVSYSAPWYDQHV